ncbi:Bug family tripartite tricarboxylate transporter substrate binding protein [Ferrovibrio sp.]|uniref:Bug family tripartite tricarboxylate transporter substrate binding protein n=1 Tax=Ferrovibrio sp. TaxID=1917215 RepID=UPI003D28C83C
MKSIRRLIANCLVVFSIFLLASPLFAQDFPNKPLRIVVPFPPGGVTDLVARAIARTMSEDLGQQVIIDNRPGAGGKIGTQHVALSAADGYTMGLMTSGTHAILPVIDPKLGYDAVKDFTPVGLIMSAPFSLYVAATAPYKTVADLVAAAKAAPGKLNYASAGVGTAHHMFFELFKATAGVDIVHVPYRGEAPAVNDMLGSQIEMMMMPGGNQHVTSGKFRPLATTGDTRWFLLPEAPTMKEAGLPGATAVGWSGLVMPANPPAAIAQRLQASLAKALQTAETRKVMRDAGFDVITAPASDLTEWTRADIAKWSNLVKTANLKFEDQ